MSRPKVYRRHSCRARHRSYNKLARCVWRHAAWVHGEGPYAVLAHCRELTVTLWRTLVDAEDAKRAIDATACGGRCHHDHEVVILAALAQARSWDEGTA